MKQQTLHDVDRMEDAIVQTIISASTIEVIANRAAEIMIEKIRPLLSSASIQDDAILDVKRLARYLKTTEAWVREQARNGNIPCFKSGKTWKFHKSKIDKFFQSRALLPISTANIK